MDSPEGAAMSDPFYIIRAEIISQYNDIQQKLNRFHMLNSSHPDRKGIAREVNDDCDSITEQLEILSESAVETSAANPARFNLTLEEIGSRRKWVQTQKRQVLGIKDSIKTITAGPQLPPAAEKTIAANEAFLGSAVQRQEQIMREQDTQLDSLAKGVDNVQMMGDQIKIHIAEDVKLLEDVERNVDSLGSRLKATSKRMTDIMKKSGTMSQIVLIIVLMVIVAVLAYFVFA